MLLMAIYETGYSITLYITIIKDVLNIVKFEINKYITSKSLAFS